MNILLVHDYNEFEQKNDILFSHMPKWGKGSANLWVLSKQKSIHESTLGIKTYQLSKYQPISVSVAVWEKIYPHPQFDLFIDASKSLPYKYSYLLKHKTLYYFSQLRLDNLDKYKLLFSEKITKKIFNSRYYLINDSINKNKFEVLFKDKKNIIFTAHKIKNKNVNLLKITSKKDYINIVYFNENGKLDGKSFIFELFLKIARKNEGWNLLIYTNKILNLKKDFELDHPILELINKIVIKKYSSLKSNTVKFGVPKNSIVLVEGNNYELIKSIALSSIPFLILSNTVENNFFSSPMNNKLVYTSRESDKISDKLLKIVENSNEMDKLKKLEKEWVDNIIKTDSADESLKFLELI